MGLERTARRRLGLLLRLRLLWTLLDDELGVLIVPWFKVDDNLGFHHKVVAAGNPAMGLWVRAGSICAQQLTDGFVPDHMVAALGTPAQAARLVAVGLWDKAEGGYKFHGWEERQPSKAHVEAERAAAADRMRAYREKKKTATPEAPSQVSDERSPEQTANERGTNGEVRDLFGNPDPTRPDPTHKEQGRKRPTRYPDDFTPNDNNREVAAAQGVNLPAVLAQFADHHRAKGSTFLDWHLALNTWIRREKPMQTATRRPPGEGPDDWMRR